MHPNSKSHDTKMITLHYLTTVWLSVFLVNLMKTQLQSWWTDLQLPHIQNAIVAT